MEISKYRMMSGIRSHRPNPIHRNTVALGQAQTQPQPQPTPEQVQAQQTQQLAQAQQQLAQAQQQMEAAQQQMAQQQPAHAQMYAHQYPQPEAQAELQAAKPRMTQNMFKAKKYDKDHTFNYLQHRWFKKKLEIEEELTMTADQLKRFCDEAHEMGKMRQALLSEGE